MTKRQQDKRLLRTHNWIFQAFNELIFKRTYTHLPTDLIIKRAGIGRSTFYEHFCSKDEVLLHSVSWILSTLADAVTDEGDLCQIRSVADHVLDQKAMAEPLLAGSGGAAITDELSKLIEKRMTKPEAACAPDLVVPMRLIARQVAVAQITLLRGWLEDASMCSSADLAAAVCRSSRGIAAALKCDIVTNT